MREVKVDLITEDVENKEWVLYLVEDGPWTKKLHERLEVLQARIFNAIDVAIDGHLAAKFRSSRGSKVRVQVDAYDSPPKDVEQLVKAIARFIKSSAEYQRAIKNGGFVEALCLVTMMQVGRRE